MHILAVGQLKRESGNGLGTTKGCPIFVEVLEVRHGVSNFTIYPNTEVTHNFADLTNVACSNVDYLVYNAVAL